MADSLDEFEERLVLTLIHRYLHTLGWKSAEDFGAALAVANPAIEAKKADTLLKLKSVKGAQRSIILADILTILVEHQVKIVSLLEAENVPTHTVAYVKAVLARAQGREPPRGVPQILKSIMENWTPAVQPPFQPFLNGVYQMARRYKSIAAVAEDFLIWELLYIDSAKQEALVVTSEGYIYRGALFHNREKILAILLQRAVTRDGQRDVNQRYITGKLEDEALMVYSGLTVKTGDTTTLPVAADTLFLPIPEAEYPEVYAVLAQRAAEPWLNTQPERISDSSILNDFISDNPPKRPYFAGSAPWQRVALLSASPEIEPLVVPGDGGDPFFAMPRRTIDRKDLVRISTMNPPKIFRWSEVRERARG